MNRRIQKSTLYCQSVNPGDRRVFLGILCSNLSRQYYTQRYQVDPLYNFFIYFKYIIRNLIILLNVNI